MSAAQAWFIAGTIVAIVAGALHMVYALVDTVRPTYFAPVDRSVRPAMEGTGLRLGRRFGARRSLWSVWLGIHIGFGLGILLFGLLCLAIAADDFSLVERVDAIRPLTIAFSAGYLALSLRFFFSAPAIITGVATACFTIATLLSL